MLNDKENNYLGKHAIAEFYECNVNLLDNVEKIEELLTNAAIECGATIVEKCFHRFSPYGVSGVVIIAESHISVHTWPEYAYAAVDLFTCGASCNTKRAYDYLVKAFNSKKSSYNELQRGLLDINNKLKEEPFVIGV